MGERPLPTGGGELYRYHDGVKRRVSPRRLSRSLPATVVPRGGQQGVGEGLSALKGKFT